MFDINWRPDDRTLRKFGVSMLIMGIAASGILWFRHSPVPSFLFFLLGSGTWLLHRIRPSWCLPVYKAWMFLAWIMGLVISPLVLGLFYYLVITPIGLCLRLAGHDKLQLRKRPAGSYWSKISTPPAHNYERQF